MDGLLIDSEPLWQEAEITVFTKLGVPLTPKMTHQTTGLRVDEVVDYWYKRYAWDSLSHKEVCSLIDNTGMELVRDRGVAKPGVDELISLLESSGLPIGIASSSSQLFITIVLDKLGIADKIKFIHSAHDEKYGKPHPDVYLSTAQELGVHPSNCLAFEGSANGVLAAKAAKMKCIAVPEAHLRTDKRFGIADLILDSLNDFTSEMLIEL